MNQFQRAKIVIYSETTKFMQEFKLNLNYLTVVC